MMTENHYGLPFDDQEHRKQINCDQTPVDNEPAIFARYSSALPSIALYARVNGMDSLFEPHIPDSASHIDDLLS